MRAHRLGRRLATQVLEEKVAIGATDTVELDAERKTRVARPSSVKHTRDGRLRVEPAIATRKADRHDELFAGENAARGAHEHSFGRQIQRKIADERKIVLANDLAIETNVPAERTANGCK